MKRSCKQRAAPRYREAPLRAGDISLREQLYRAALLAVAGSVVRGAAHELNNPLTAVLGFSSALLTHINSGQKVDRKELSAYLQIIHDEAIRCRGIVDRFYRFSRGGGDSGGHGFSLHECVAGAIRMVSTNAARAEITLVNNFEADYGVDTDSGRLELLLVGLLMNRICCCAAGATVTVSGTPGRSVADAAAVVLVSDDAASQALADAGGASDDFFVPDRDGKGICIGFGFCKRAAEEIGGRFNVESGGRGTTIRLEIPAGSVT